MESPPSPPDRIRLTISVTPEVHATFTRFAKATGQSVGRCMGDWLGDTMEAAEHATTLVERARQAPRLAARELHAYALGLADETREVLDKVLHGKKAGAASGDAGSAAGGAAPARHPAPPSGNTGGKPPRTRKKPGGV